MRLRTLQTAFMQSIMQPMQNHHIDTTLAALLSPPDKLNNISAINIYKNNVIGARINALYEIYPICLKILGDTYFQQIAYQYVFLHKPISHDLNQYGGQLSTFLTSLIEKHTELAELPYLPDLAKFEYIWNNTFYAIDSGNFDFNNFATIPSDQQSNIKFKLNNSLNIISSEFPILLIWEQNRKNKNTDFVLTNDVATHYWLTIRINNEIEIHTINKEQFSFIQNIQKNTVFADLLKTDNQHKLLITLIEKQWISDYTIDAESSN